MEANFHTIPTIWPKAEDLQDTEKQTNLTKHPRATTTPYSDGGVGLDCMALGPENSHFLAGKKWFVDRSGK